MVISVVSAYYMAFETQHAQAKSQSYYLNCVGSVALFTN